MNTFLGNYLDSRAVIVYCSEAFGMYLEIELRSEANSTEHTQGVIRKGYRRLERSSDSTEIQVIESGKRIDKFAEIAFVKAYSQSIYGKIATLLVILNASAFNYRVAAVEIVRFLACTDKLQLCSIVNKHRSTICLENAYFPHFQMLCELAGKVNAIAVDDNVDIVLFWTL